MLPTKDEIMKILERDIYATPGESRRIAHVNGIETAADAIAALLTPAHRMSEFVYSAENYRIGVYYVPGGESRLHIVYKNDDHIVCHSQQTDKLCSSNDGRTTCDHIKAVELYLVREGAKC